MFKKEDAFQCALCMDLTEDKFQFSIVDRKQKKILHFEEHAVTEFTSEFLSVLLSNELLKHEFASFSLSTGNKRNTLIPFELFSHSKPLDIFKLNYAAPIDNLDFNRIPELGIVNIYEIPLWIKSLFVIRFPRIKIIHCSTVLIKGIFDKPAFFPKAHLLIEKEQFYFIITDQSKLAYFNRFDYKELADLVYYILFVFEQKEYDQANFELHLYGLPVDWDQLEKLQEFFKKKIRIAHKTEDGKNFILAKQLLCV